MNFFLKPIFLAVVVFGSLPLFAVDIPTDDLGVQQFDQETCISNEVDLCITNICINSDQIDCQSNCQRIAQEKCQQQTDE